jgi:hypothetical protein
LWCCSVLSHRFRFSGYTFKIDLYWCSVPPPDLDFQGIPLKTARSAVLSFWPDLDFQGIPSKSTCSGVVSFLTDLDFPGIPSKTNCSAVVFFWQDLDFQGRGNRRSISATCECCSMRRIMSGRGCVDFFVIFRKQFHRTHNPIC